jgi:tRNA-splicing ligase RtcB
MKLNRLTHYLYEVPKQGGMRVPGRIYASEPLMETQKQDEAIGQVMNVAHLPGIVKYALAMPDFHWGYGFPVGGVAAFDMEEGVISPGGVGYDINCGVRLLATRLKADAARPQIHTLVRALYKAIPAGVGEESSIPTPTVEEFKHAVTRGAAWSIDRGFGRAEDAKHIEEYGCLEGADFSCVSKRAIERGRPQMGSLGSGNHFAEVQVVQEVYLPEEARRLGIEEGDVCFMIHSGSRGFGHQICDDYLGTMVRAAGKYNIHLPDRQLCCAPVGSDEARRYLGAMKCAANFAWNNRQIMAGIAERAFMSALGMGAEELGMRLIYDVCHNIAKVEEFLVDGKPRRLMVHRKGATRALGPGHPLVPEAYRSLGQPVIIPGDMGRHSFLLLGTQQAESETFGSSCHGAGRVASRSAMLKKTQGRDLFSELKSRHDVVVMAHGRASVAEEMPEAYKDAGEVVQVIQGAGISKVVLKLKPIGCIKG